MTPPAPAANGSPYNPTTTASATEDRGEPPAKRTKTQACSRCRRRKTDAAISPPPLGVQIIIVFTTAPRGTPLAWLSDIASLEERISRLEVTDPRLQAVVNNQSNHDQLSRAPEPLLP
ncbi:hypothetical protein CNYM01_12906 [Colletotrichum nymphaeae SA-01]|uniref:Uncharacterized protein n=1 Tax=Colletotrichum nymphaeae SA-01 TaxID=1460502 RepID=A0A135RXW5_9PEZI|nr:hypothetical protein CNYM01_12906 [Colletotrichum nymphaeae SA-01]